MKIKYFLKRVAMLAGVVALSFFALQAQDFRYPLDVAMSLSGNYGELRSNHFHGGIDFRVGGVVGAPIYATESGYVSRITIGPSGYGNALYITHPNGYDPFTATCTASTMPFQSLCWRGSMPQRVSDRIYPSPRNSSL